MIRGTKILRGKEAKRYSAILEDFRKICYTYGYEEVVIPSIREQKTFVDKAGSEILNQMFAFQDKKDRDICLIPEVTAVIQEEWRTNWQFTEKKPYKIFYVSRCYRYERPQAGRQREFTQFGLEILGKSTPQDAEILVRIARQFVETIVGLEYEYKPSVKRGLSYYTEEGFEIECPILGAQKQVCGGGRYAEGIGFAVGIERLLLARELLDASCPRCKGTNRVWDNGDMTNCHE